MPYEKQKFEKIFQEQKQVEHRLRILIPLILIFLNLIMYENLKKKCLFFIGKIW